MERRGQDRDTPRMHNSNYSALGIVQESDDRRGNFAVSARGAAIFSPNQILDHRQLPSTAPPVIPHSRSPPPPPPVQRSRTPDLDTDSDPARGGDGSNSTSKALPPPPPPPPMTAAAVSGVRYKECLKNHAASMGGHVVDGCGEYMPGGDEGTAEEMRCAACDCHRNFHRIEVTGEPRRPGRQYYPHNPIPGNNRMPIVRSQNPASAPRHPHHHEHSSFAANVGRNGGMAAESSSEDLNMFESPSGKHAGTFSGSKKRFRTKFSQEQKDLMQAFADKLGWRMQKQDDPEVRQFCEQTGVKRQVFKVWMHNNKQLKKRQT